MLRQGPALPHHKSYTNKSCRILDQNRDLTVYERPCLIDLTQRRGESGTNLVLLRDSNDLFQAAHLSLHAVDALNNEKDLLPRPVGTRLSLRDRRPQQLLQILRVVVLEYLLDGPAAKFP